MTSGIVSIDLDDYERMQEEIRHLRSTNEELKRKLLDAEGKVWKIFGNFFKQKSKAIFAESPYTLENALIIECKNPKTFVRFDSYDYDKIPDKTLVIRHLIEEHIADVITNIDFSGLEQWLYQKKKK